MAEDAWQNIPYSTPTTSVFQAGWPKADPFPPHNPEVWALLRSVRDDVNACMEKARVDKLVGANLDAEVFVHVPDAGQARALKALRAPETPKAQVRAHGALPPLGPPGQPKPCSGLHLPAGSSTPLRKTR